MKVNHVSSVVTVLRNRSEGSDAAENLGRFVRDPQVTMGFNTIVWSSDLDPGVAYFS